MSPVLANKIPGFKAKKIPLDFGLKYRGTRVFGENKSLNGLVVGTLMGGLTAIIVSKLNANTVITVAPFLAGCLLGFGALAGDAVESFFKRQFGVRPGESWFPFDQIDYIIGGLLAIYPFQALPFWVITTIFIAYFGLHLAVSYLGYKLGFKDKPI